MIVIMFDQIFGDIEGTRTIAFEAGATIFRQGAPSRAIFQVQTGRVAMVRQLADGTLATVFTAGPQDTFAEAAMFSDIYHCDAVAQTSCTLLSVPTAAIHQMLAREPQRAIRLAALFAGQVRDLRSRVELLRVKRAPDRLLAWLRARAKGNPPTAAPAGPWASVASEIGLSPEALYRALSALESGGKIKRTKQGMVLMAPSG